ncbi:MAG: hypothetical protein J6C85_00935 [Alphaproteobacteria bacterium]|nr:hypothetical protein [Alphaproteobacteria bacterium]
MKNEDETKLVEKEKVKLLAVLVLMLAGVGAAFELERAFRPRAEATVVVYENGEVAEAVKRDEAALPVAAAETQQVAAAEPDVVKAEAKEANAFFEYLKEVDSKLNDLERREAVLDKIATLKPQAAERATDKKRDDNVIEVYDNAGEVAQVIEDKADEAAEEAAVLSEVLGQEAEAAEEVVSDTADVAQTPETETAVEEAKEAIDVLNVEESVSTEKEALAVEGKALESKNEKESVESVEPVENTDKNNVAVDSDGAIDMMKEIIAQEEKAE